MRKYLLLMMFITFTNLIFAQRIYNKVDNILNLKVHRQSSAIEFYHEGLRYKNGDGVSINYRKAFQNFKTAADMGDAQSEYATAYFYYKGLGVQQNYQIAAGLFAKGAKEGRDNSMYFYGLCFENGYGISKNTDSARYWLGKAASLGYKQAIEELKAPIGENANDSAVALLDKISNSMLPEKRPLNEFTLVEPHIPSKDLINGTYNGFVLRYDWSGRYLISSKPIQLSLQNAVDSETETNSLKGTWQEKGETAVPLKAELAKDSVIFKQTEYQTRDHYSWDNAIIYDFKSANLNLTQTGDSVYLSGNIAMFSPERNEPSKPIYLALVRSDAVASSLKDSINALFNKNALTDSSAVAKIKGAKLYPNPFKSSFSVEFILTGDAKVALQLINMSGMVIYKKPEKFLQKGKYIINVSPGKVGSGMYILRIMSGSANYVDLKAIRE